MDKKKYELTNETKYVLGYTGYTLYRIKALRDFGKVKKGDLGGFIGTEENLSHDGLAWISDEACVFENALVSGNAIVSDNALVHGNAKVFYNAHVGDKAHVFGRAYIGGHAWIYGSAEIHDNAQIDCDAQVSGNAVVSEYAIVSDKARICDDVYIHSNCHIYNNAHIYGDACIDCNARISKDANIEYTEHYMVFDSFGSRDATTTIYRATNGVRVMCGCFEGTLDEFRKKVKETHGDNRYAKEYLAIADIAEIRFGKEEEE